MEYRFFLFKVLFILCWGTLFQSCYVSEKKREPSSSGVYVSLHFDALRVAEEVRGRESALEEPTNLKSLRIIIFPSGEEQPIVNELISNVRTAQNIVFKLNTLTQRNALYDFYFIANEWTSHTQQFNTLFTRTEWESFRLPFQVRNSVDLELATQDPNMYTACYKGVPLSKNMPGTGAYEDPFQIDFTQWNREQRPNLPNLNRSSVELMAIAAKIEIILKDVVTVQGSRYEWVLPYGFQDRDSYVLRDVRLQVHLDNVPAYFYLFPTSSLYDGIKGRVPLLPPKLAIVRNPREALPIWKRIVWIPEESSDQKSIGGIITAHIRYSVFVPEYLSSTSLPENSRPQITIGYYTQESSYTKQYQSFVLQNPEGRTHYEHILQNLSERAPWNIYRSRLYKIEVNIGGRPFYPSDPESTDSES